MIRLDPRVLDKAKAVTGSRSDDQLGQAFLNLTGVTVRSYRAGKSLPTIVTLAKLRELTGIPLDRMVINDAGSHAA
ncbi:hypothetical protein [Corynebacterium urealyticum]|uniref:hypothetical protein n=1 Tax=Corynebacterium urealyticum TaxID=43771 RepID=UPI0011E83B3B|nr:hypothetical protein [Corynebacterium urealyticum]TYR15601.1 hypothetical protein FYJ89_03475 [Corynebacterium urealyticum]TYR17937.1 hypothetical protein FYJ88_03675 [Corynebacterium urealyticum]